MNRCDIDMLSLYLDGDMSLPARRRVELHLLECPECAGEVESLRQIDQMLVAWGASRTPVSPIEDARIVSAVERKRRLKPFHAASKIMPAAVGSSIAAMLVLLSVNTGFLYGNQTNQQQPAGTTIAARVIEKQSAPLLRARRSSAIMVGRTDVQINTALRHHTLLEVD
jgi:anti-sigma factor RsiW